MPFLILYLGTLVPFLILDALMIRYVIGPLFTAHLGPILASPPRVIPAALFYLGYPLAVVALTSLPALRTGASPLVPALILGLAAYATYELTSLSLMSAWTPAMSALDMAWGTALTAISASIGLALARYFGQA
jgi:uncharacterized membrane protein